MIVFSYQLSYSNYSLLGFIFNFLEPFTDPTYRYELLVVSVQ